MVNYAVAFLSITVAYFASEVLKLEQSVASMSKVLEKNQRAIIDMQLEIERLEQSFDTLDRRK